MAGAGAGRLSVYHQSKQIDDETRRNARPGGRIFALQRHGGAVDCHASITRGFVPVPTILWRNGGKCPIFTKYESVLPDLPVAIEFRHPSWYLPAYRAATIDLLKAAGDIHVVVDEAQTVSGSVPLVPIATNPELTILRLHGRNQAWGQSGAKTTERTNYRYSQAELEAFALIVKHLKSKNVTVIFNNNGGHDAAANAQQFIDMLGLDFPGLAPRQLDLF